MVYIVDSSVWIALFLDFDIQHKKAVRFFDGLRGTFYMPYCIVNEVTTVLAYKHSKQQADNFLNYAENNHDIVLIDDSFQEEISFYKSLPHKVSFTDAAFLFLSEKLSAELATFDKQLIRIARKLQK